MKTTVKIEHHKGGFILRINGMYIGSRLDAVGNTKIYAITDCIGVPYGANNWISVDYIRDFWHKYMPMIIASTTHPVISYWGRLIPKSAIENSMPGERYSEHEETNNHGCLRHWIEYTMRDPWSGEEFSCVYGTLDKCRTEGFLFLEKCRNKEYAAEKSFFHSHPELNP